MLKSVPQHLQMFQSTLNPKEINKWYKSRDVSLVITHDLFAPQKIKITKKNMKADNEKFYSPE
jgi:hypothetical protein